jgi:hydroxyacylglutathione hydrolase
MSAAALPASIVWQERPFPNCNFLLLTGDEPTLVDTGFVAHAEETTALTADNASQLNWVFNTHWHSDHVGANSSLQAQGVGIIGSDHDAAALERHDPGCCMAEYLDQPVPQYSVDQIAGEGESLSIGAGQWQVIAVPGHTPGHLSLWNSDDRLLAVGDVMSAYDVGWVNIMLEGATAVDDALNSVRTLQEFDARMILPGHGPLVDAPEPALAKAEQRLLKQRGNLDIAADYGAKRILAFALMIHGGMTATTLDDYLAAQQWPQDAAAMLGSDRDRFADDLVSSILKSGALVSENGTIRAAAESAQADAAIFDLPFPKDWVSR